MRNSSRFSVMALPAASLIAMAALIGACAGVEVTDPDLEGPPTEVPVRSIAVTPRLGTVAQGARTQLQAAVMLNGVPEPSPSISWHSTNIAIATVSASGEVNAVSPGDVFVVAASGTASDRAALTVVPMVASVVVAPASASVTVGGTVTLAASPRGPGGEVLSGRTIVWSSSSNFVATVSASGVVTGQTAGTVIITANAEGQRAEASVVVNPPQVAVVTLSSASMSMPASETRSITATARDAGGALLPGRTATWTSSNSAVATVASTGTSSAGITAVGAGAATITATIEGQTASAQVTVTNTAPVAVASVTVSPSTATVGIGATSTLTAQVRDAGGAILTGRAVTWTTNASSVATVSSGGVVTGRAQGTATITATSEGRSGTSVITVPAPTVPPPAGTLAFTNAPSGLTTATNADWSTWPSGWVNERASTVGLARLISDATAPMSPSGVLEEAFLTGMPGGTAPANVVFHGTNGATEVFVGFWFKMSTNFEGHSSGVNKLVNLWTPFDIHWLRVNAYREYDNDGSRLNGPYYLVATNQSSEFDLLQNRVPTMIPIVPGQWHKIEWHLTTAGAASGNGRMRFWLDGVLLGDYSNLASTIGSEFWEFQISPTWGGVGGTTTRDSFMRFDQMFISRR